MGTVSLYTFVAGSVPTASQWNLNPVAIAAAINGEVDEANIQTADSDGVVGMSVTQTTANSNPITGPKDFTGAIGLNGGVVVNEASADVNFRVETNAHAHAIYADGGKDALVFGSSTDVSSTDTPFLIDHAARSASATVNFDRFKVGGTNAITIPSGTTALVTGVHIAEPNLTATGTITKASTLYVAAAPTEGTSANHALEVAAGLSRFGGAVSVDDTTESTSTVSGSIHTDGGLGVAGDIYAGDDIFFASGAVLNFAAGDVTLTHASGKLTFGGDGAVELDFNNHEMTNVDIDSGTIDGAVMASVDINSGSIDDTVIGAASARAGTFTDLTTSGAVVVGTDGSGNDVKLFGDTSGKYVLWDESADTLLFPDSTPITMGTGSDATVQFDATNLVYNTAGYHSFTGGDLHVGNGQGMVIGHTAQVAVGAMVPEVQILGTTHGVDGSLVLGTWSTTDDDCSTLWFVKSCQGTIGALNHDVRLEDSENLGQIVWAVDDGEDLNHHGCIMRVSTDGWFGSAPRDSGNHVPSRWSIFVTTDLGTSAIERLRVNSAGDTYTNDGTIHSLSDISSKKDVSDFTDGLSIINRLRPIKFKYNGKYGMGADDGVERFGFSAQEVQQVAPYLVDQSSENTNITDDISAPEIRVPVLGMSQGRLIPVMVNALKEVEVRLAALEAA